MFWCVGTNSSVWAINTNEWTRSSLINQSPMKFHFWLELADRVIELPIFHKLTLYSLIHFLWRNLELKIVLLFKKLCSECIEFQLNTLDNWALQFLYFNITLIIYDLKNWISISINLKVYRSSLFNFVSWNISFQFWITNTNFNFIYLLIHIRHLFIDFIKIRWS